MLDVGWSAALSQGARASRPHSSRVGETPTRLERKSAGRGRPALPWMRTRCRGSAFVEWRLEAAMVGKDGFPAVVVRPFFARRASKDGPFFSSLRWICRGASRSVGVPPTFVQSGRDAHALSTKVGRSRPTSPTLAANALSPCRGVDCHPPMEVIHACEAVPGMLGGRACGASSAQHLHGASDGIGEGLDIGGVVVHGE